VVQFEVGLLLHHWLASSEENCPNIAGQQVSVLSYETGNFHLQIRSKAHWTEAISTSPQTIAK
jgi:hypothetical protein